MCLLSRDPCCHSLFHLKVWILFDDFLCPPCSAFLKAGLGTKEEFGHLSLKHEENFCMGGPGVILSRDTLFRVALHVNHCVQHLLTNHEDVELGRCIHQFAGVTCTWAYEVTYFDLTSPLFPIILFFHLPSFQQLSLSICCSLEWQCYLSVILLLILVPSENFSVPAILLL